MQPHEKLEAALNARRVELRMSWRELVKAAQLSPEGLRAIRRGARQPTEVTKARIEDAVGWMPGSIETVYAGGEPTPLPEATEPRSTEAAELLTQELEELAATRKLLQSALDQIDRIERLRRP